MTKNSDEVLSIICDAASTLKAGVPANQNSLEASMVMLLRELLVRHPECAEQNCMKKLVNQYPAAIGALHNALDSVLGVYPRQGM